MRRCCPLLARGLALIGCVCASLALGGCSREERLEVDPGASPFLPAANGSKVATKKARESAGKAWVKDSETPEADKRSSGDAPKIDARFGTNEVERQLRVALRTAQKGDPAVAAEQLDKILAVEPIHRKALLGRASVALKQANLAKDPKDRAAAIEKAVTLTLSLVSAYDTLKPPEFEFAKRAFYARVKVLTEQGRIDQAMTALQDASDRGLDPIARVESDPSMASLRSTPSYQAVLKRDEERTLAIARANTKDLLAAHKETPFNFTLADLAGQKVSLGDFRGKVVVVDFWGTWCGPCREAIPGLIALYNRRHPQGLEIVGLSYEKEAKSESQARELIKKFVKVAGVPYTCLLGETDVIKQVPGFQGFPTTLIIDRAGKVRTIVTENSSRTLELVTDVVRVLLAEPVGKPDPPAKKP